METLRFEELGICPEIQKAVKHMGFEEASPIQSKAIPVMMKMCIRDRHRDADVTLL